MALQIQIHFTVDSLSIYIYKIKWNTVSANSNM